MHVTLRVVKGVRWLRGFKTYPAVRRAVRARRHPVVAYGLAVALVAAATLIGWGLGAPALFAGSLSARMSPGFRPDRGTDENGLWDQFDKEEEKLKRSRFLIRDPELNAYIAGIACRVAGDYCRDMRVYIVRTPYFNASMAPNGMMQVWSGCLLRCQSEAQIAAVIGHEIGHYLRRHGVDRFRDAQQKAAFSALLGLGLSVAGAGRFGAAADAVVLAAAFALRHSLA